MAPSPDVLSEPRPTLWVGVLRSWWCWSALALALIASPMLFLSTLVVGAFLVAAGILAWVRYHWSVAIALGAGLLLGSLPYAVVAVLRIMGLR